MNERGVFKGVILLLSAIILVASFVFAASSSEPQGPELLNVTESGRRTPGTVDAISAEAGNVSALVIDDIRTTEAWQGYYGNVTGTITLDDANNVTFYDWALPNPEGEIYASNGSSVTWSNVYCMNLSHTRPNDGSTGSGFESTIYYNINMTQIEANFGINNTELGAPAEDMDGLNETFNATYNDATGFRVGSITIDDDDGCSLAHLYTDESRDSNWQELLLTDNVSLIFTALIRENADMYRTAGTETADFQILVLENGHTGGAESVTTPYYFFVELS
jgi:hypothetical protein